MGQYYHGVILDAKTRKPIMATYPMFMKLIESAIWDMSRMVYELSAKGSAYKQRVTWAGDYSAHKDYNGETLWEFVHGNRVPEAMGKEMGINPITAREFTDAWYDQHDRFFRQYVTDDKDVIREEFRYLCNHDRREYVDLMPFYKAKKRAFWNPLAILTSDPTCRCQGGGDYFFREDFEYYGAWNEGVLSAEPKPVSGYKKLLATFPAKTRIDGDRLEKLLAITPVAAIPLENKLELAAIVSMAVENLKSA